MPTIPANQNAFVTNAGGPPLGLTFAIPSGTYSAAIWKCSGTAILGVEGGATGTCDEDVSTGSGNHSYSADITCAVGGSAFGPITWNATASQLANINAAAGGTLSATILTSWTATGGGISTDAQTSPGNLWLILTGVAPTYPRNVLYQPEEWLPEWGLWQARVGLRGPVPMRPRSMMVMPEEWLPEWQGLTRPLVRYLPPTPFGVVTIVGSLPFPENCSVQQFVTVSYPYGYARVTLDPGLGAAFESARPRGNVLAYLQNHVLILTDTTGRELTPNAVCPVVDIWRFRYG